MSEMDFGIRPEHDIPRDYWNDGRVRRTLHEYGRRRFPFYEKAFEALGIGPEDTVLDVGAGMGDDALTIANKYHPKLIYVLEPPPADLSTLGAKFEPLEMKVAEINDPQLVFLPADAINDYHTADALEPTEGTTCIKPIYSPAEAIPLTPKTVSKALVIHSAPEFTDLAMAFSELAEVMTDDGEGLMILNGPDDKLQFKKFLETYGQFTGRRTPATVSTGLDYNAGAALLRDFFDEVEVFPYRDEMVITEGDRLNCYLHAFDTYNLFFGPPAPDSAWPSWLPARQAVVDSEIARQMALNNGEFIDTIDTAWIKFSRPRINK